MSSLKAKGDIGELSVARQGIINGFVVSFPSGDGSAFDMIFAHPKTGKCYKIQSKYCNHKRGSRYRIDLRRARATKGTNKRLYKKNEVDVFGVYLSDIDQVIFIPRMRKSRFDIKEENIHKFKKFPH